MHVSTQRCFELLLASVAAASGLRSRYGRTYLQSATFWG